jgi:hypothetical protein
MPIRDVVTTTIKLLGAWTLAAGVFWQVAEHAGNRDCVAYVHVTEPRVDVTIDDQTYQIEAWQAVPIVSELRAGRHTLKMTRRGQILYEETFDLRPGQEVVLTAWEKTRAEPKREYVPASATETLNGL